MTDRIGTWRAERPTRARESRSDTVNIVEAAKAGWLVRYRCRIRNFFDKLSGCLWITELPTSTALIYQVSVVRVQVPHTGDAHNRYEAPVPQQRGVPTFGASVAGSTGTVIDA